MRHLLALKLIAQTLSEIIFVILNDIFMITKQKKKKKTKILAHPNIDSFIPQN